MWFSVNTVVTTVPIGQFLLGKARHSADSNTGMLAQAYFFLDFQHAVAAIVAFSAIGAATVGFIATLGPRTGLRTMVSTLHITCQTFGHLTAIRLYRDTLSDMLEAPSSPC